MLKVEESWVETSLNILNVYSDKLYLWEKHMCFIIWNAILMKKYIIAFAYLSSIKSIDQLPKFSDVNYFKIQGIIIIK